MENVQSAENYLQQGEELYDQGDYNQAYTFAAKAIEVEFRENGNRYKVGPFDTTPGAVRLIKRCLGTNKIQGDQLKQAQGIIADVTRKAAMTFSKRDRYLYYAWDAVRLIFYAGMVVVSIFALFTTVSFILDILDGGTTREHPLLGLALAYGIIGTLVLLATGGMGLFKMPTNMPTDEGCIFLLILFVFMFALAAVLYPVAGIVLGSVLFRDHFRVYAL